MNNNSGNSNWKIFAGLAAGAAAGWWLNSNRGRQWRKKNAEWVYETGQNLTEQAKTQIENVKDNVNTMVDNAKSSIVDYLDTAETKVDQTANAIETGTQVAKRKVNKKMAQISEVLEN